MSKWNLAVAALWVTAITSVFLLPPARSQQAESQPEAYVGMIVTRSAEDAQAVLNQLKAGMDFGVLAKEKSIDPSSNDGGYVGGQLTPALRDAVKGLRSGQFTGIVRVPGGFAILTVFPAAPKTQDLDAKQIQSLASATVVRQTINVAGMSEEDSVFEQYSKNRLTGNKTCGSHVRFARHRIPPLWNVWNKFCPRQAAKLLRSN